MNKQFSSKKKLSIIIPVFNEESTIKAIIDKIKSLEFPKNLIREIIVINDGSTDSTSKILKEIKQIKLISHKKNSGKGSAVKTGFKYAKGDIIAIQDADLEYDPKDLLRLVNFVFRNRTSVCFGNRLKNYPLRLWGKNKTILPSHWVANKLLSYFTSLLYGSAISDMETCYKLFHFSIFSKISLKANKFDFEPEITAKILRQGLRIYEIDIKTTPRTHSEG